MVELQQYYRMFQLVQSKLDGDLDYSLSIYVIHDFISSCCTVCDNKVLSHPRHKVVLERSFDNLMQQIWGKEFMDISIREVVGERLRR